MSIPVLANITLDGYTVRVSSQGIRRADSGTIYHYKPRMAAPEIVNSLGDMDIAVQYPGTVNLTIDNTDGWLDAYLPGGASEEIWTNRRVDIYTGGTEGADLSAMTLEFSGYVPIGGMSLDRTTIKLRLNDLREGHNVSFGGYIVNATDYPTAPDSSLDTIVPWITGDFTGLTNGDAISCTPIVVSGTTVQFYASTTPINSSGAVVYHYDASGASWSIIVPSVTDYANGKFTATSIDLSTGDLVTIGAEFYDSGSGGAASDAPADVLEWLLDTVASVSAGDIDSASFATAKTDGDTAAVRRIVYEDTTLFNEINALAFEAGYDLYVKNGKYTCKWFAPVVASSTTATGGQIIDGTFTTSIDPDRMYCNRVEVSYYYDSAESSKKITREDATEQSSFGRVVAKQFIYRWLHVTAQVSLSIDRKLYFWKQIPEQAEFSIGYEDASSAFYSMYLTDGLKINYWRFSSSGFWIRRVANNLLTGTIAFRAINMDSIENIGVWDNDSPTVASPGYWNNDAGTGASKTVWW